MLRLFDLVFAALGLTLGFPILLMLFVVGLADTGSPLFVQTRVGRHQQPFALVKFRTMKPNTASVATHLADPNAVTRWGKFLRASKLDELPQLWNVLKGEMSLVGPRPLLMEYLPLYTPEQARRHDVRPGITGWAQVNQGHVADIDAVSTKLRLDFYYVKNAYTLGSRLVTRAEVMKLLGLEGRENESAEESEAT